MLCPKVHCINGWSSKFNDLISTLVECKNEQFRFLCGLDQNQKRKKKEKTDPKKQGKKKAEETHFQDNLHCLDRGEQLLADSSRHW